MNGIRIARRVVPIVVTFLIAGVAQGQPQGPGSPLPAAPPPTDFSEKQPPSEHQGPVVSPYVEHESPGAIEAPPEYLIEYEAPQIPYATPYRQGPPRRVRAAAGCPPIHSRMAPSGGACGLPPMISADGFPEGGYVSETCGECGVEHGAAGCGVGLRQADCCDRPHRYRKRPAEKAPCLRITTEALFLSLSDPGVQPLIVSAAAPQTPLVSTDSLDYDTQSMTRLTLELYCKGGRSAVQFIYYGTEWDTHTAAAGGVVLPNGLLAGTFISARADAALNNEEINFLHRIDTSHLSLLYGFRHIGFDEKLRLASVQAAPPNSFYDISTKNDLFGIQVGARYVIPLDRFLIEMTGKVGAYESISSQHSLLSDAALAIQSDTAASDRRGACVGEFGINLLFPLGDNVRVSAGYNLLWIGSLARAADQIESTPVTSRSLDHGGDAFLHGANIGLQFAL